MLRKDWPTKIKEYHIRMVLIQEVGKTAIEMWEKQIQIQQDSERLAREMHVDVRQVAKKIYSVLAPSEPYPYGEDEEHILAKTLT